MSILCTIGKKQLPVVSVIRTSGILRNYQREMLQLTFKTSEVGYEELYDLLKDSDNCRKIMSTNNPSPEAPEVPISTALFENYMVPGEPLLAVTKSVVQAEVGESEEVFVVTLGKLTSVEEKLLAMGINPVEV